MPNDSIPKVCSIDGCHKPASTRGWCRMHYVRFNRHGDPLKLMTCSESVPVSEKLLSGIEIVTETGCWIWVKSINNHGYGIVGIRGTKTYSHRSSFKEFVGDIPEGMCVLHRCDTPCCINPYHLFLGTMKDNSQDMAAKGRHYHGEMHHWAKLTNEQVCGIKHRLSLGHTQRDIAKDYGVSQCAISDINIGKRRKYL